MEEACGGTVPFRIAESPLFLPRPLLTRLAEAGAHILAEACGSPAAHAAARRRVPEPALADPPGAHPTFVQLDFALARGPQGEVVPRLTELQGFPSLYAFQHVLAAAFQRRYGLPPSLCDNGAGLGPSAFVDLLRRAVVGSHDPETVALVDVRPWEQGTWPDFRLTARLLPGVAVVDAASLERRGDRLFYRRGGTRVPIRRLYNRLVYEEAAASALPFRLGEALDVEWVDHPGWFFRLSKSTLPFLHHETVPRACFLDEAEVDGEELSRFVLKPLFSFSGRGLVLDVDDTALAAVPEAERPRTLLQEKFTYADVIEGPEGPIRCELRLMYLWLDEPVLAGFLPRMSRGRLMGCAHNRTDPWTGHGVAFTEPAS